MTMSTENKSKTSSTKIILAVGAGAAVVLAVVVSMWYMQNQADRAAAIHAAKLNDVYSTCQEFASIHRSLNTQGKYEPYDYPGCVNATKKLYGLTD